MAPQEVAQRCSCGRTYTLLEWHQLPYRGLQSAPAGDDPRLEPPFILELRDCQSVVMRSGVIETCGSTISREVTPATRISTQRGPNKPGANIWAEELMDAEDLAEYRAHHQAVVL